MNECHRIGIKNFKSIRHPEQIKLVFDLCTDDISAVRHVSSKGDNYNNTMAISDFNKPKLNYFPIKKSNNDWLQYFKILMNFIINILYLIFRVICLIFKYIIWCIFKIVLCIIFRVLTKSKVYRPKAFICHPVRCNHHRF
jgi:hypothetical protein